MKITRLLFINYLAAVFGLILYGQACAAPDSDDERRKTQAVLDFACEVARAQALAPTRRKIFSECMKKRNDREYCYRDAIAFDGIRQGGIAPYYDLPACVRAFEYKKSHRERY
jgi:hypothetical protein